MEADGEIIVGGVQAGRLQLTKERQKAAAAADLRGLFVNCGYAMQQDDIVVDWIPQGCSNCEADADCAEALPPSAICGEDVVCFEPAPSNPGAGELRELREVTCPNLHVLQADKSSSMLMCMMCGGGGVGYRCSQGCKYDLCTNCYMQQRGRVVSVAQALSSRGFSNALSSTGSAAVPTLPAIRQGSYDGSSPPGPSRPPVPSTSPRDPFMSAAASEGIQWASADLTKAAKSRDPYNVDGLWLNEADGVMTAEIQQGLLRWTFGQRTAEPTGKGLEEYDLVAVTFGQSGEIYMMVQGSQFTGRLVDSQRILWSDGEIWRRVNQLDSARSDLYSMRSGCEDEVSELHQAEKGNPLSEQERQVLAIWSGCTAQEPDFDQLTTSPTGQAAELVRTWRDGRTYRGGWEGGWPQGEGEFEGPGWGSYAGQWEKGQMHGEGSYTPAGGWPLAAQGDALPPGVLQPRGGAYRGQWCEGLKDGRGTEEWPDGTRYDGNFVQGKMSGGGALRLPSGVVRRIT